MSDARRLEVADERMMPPYAGFLLWLVMFNVVLFAGYVLVSEGYLARVLAGDRSYISLVIAFVFVAASLHAAVHIFRTGGLLLRAADLLDGAAVEALSGPMQLIDNYVVEMGAASEAGPAPEKGEGAALSPRRGGLDQANYVFEIYVDKLRAPLELGSFIIDVLIRLGLIGTIIGFIMMLQSFVSGPSPTEENIQELLITMSTGMGTALYTTFAGLVASTLLGLQHQLLNRNVEGVVAALIRLSSPSHLKRVPGAG